jgi:TusA-related sulfurtransferase
MASPSHDPAGTPAPVDHAVQPQSSEEPPVGAAATSRPTLVGDCGDAVAFLDGPGLDAQQLLAAIDSVLLRMCDGAILTVFTDDPTAPQIAADWCAGRRVELLAVIPHSDRNGASLTFRRAEPESGSAATGVTQF